MIRILLALLAILTAAQAAQAGDGPFSPYQWHRRLLVVFSPSENHEQLAEQVASLRRHATGYLERDMVVFLVAGEQPLQVLPVQPTDMDAEHLRRQFEVGEDEFRVVLVGKDGGVKLKEHTAIGACRLFEVIDGMPLRRLEMAEHNHLVRC